MTHVPPRRRVGAVLALALVAVGASATVLAGPVHADSTEGVTICHAAGMSGRWVVITVDPAALLTHGHRAHQGAHDVIPPFEHTAEGGASTRLAGQNWADNWPVDGSGRATGAVEASDCGAVPHAEKPQKKENSAEKQQGKPGDEQQGKPGDKQQGKSGEKRSDAPPRGEGGGSSASPSGATGTGAPHDEAQPRPALVGGGLALLLAGGATAVGVTRRRGQ